MLFSTLKLLPKFSSTWKRGKKFVRGSREGLTTGLREKTASLVLKIGPELRHHIGGEGVRSWKESSAEGGVEIWFYLR